MTAKQLSAAACVSVAYLRDLERGASCPTLDVARRIAAALGLDVDDLWPWASLRGALVEFCRSAGKGTFIGEKRTVTARRLLGIVRDVSVTGVEWRLPDAFEGAVVRRGDDGQVEVVGSDGAVKDGAWLIERIP